MTKLKNHQRPISKDDCMMLYDLILSYMILYVYINIFYSLQLKHNIYIYGTSWDIYSGTPNTNRHTHTEHHLLASLLIMYVFSSFLMPYFFFCLAFSLCPFNCSVFCFTTAFVQFAHLTGLLLRVARRWNWWTPRIACVGATKRRCWQSIGRDLGHPFFGLRCPMVL